MIDTCRSCLYLFNKHWISEVSGQIVIAETNLAGKGEAVFTVGAPCILIKPDPNVPPLWALAQQSCADAAFLSFRDGNAHLHIVELKSKITLATWAKVVKQFEGMFLTALAVARLLDIHHLMRVTCYLAGTTDGLTDPSQTASPTLLKGPVGTSLTFGNWEAWNKEVVVLPLAFEARLVKGWKDSTGIADFGCVT